MNPYAIPAAIGLFAGLAYGYRAWRSATRRLAAIREEFKPPAPVTDPVPGAGTTTRCGEPVLVITVEYYDDGHAEMHDHRRNMKITLPADDDAYVDFDGWLKGLTDGV